MANKNPIDPRSGGPKNNALGPEHNQIPLAPNSHATDAQLLGVGKGGLGHAVTKESPGAVNPLENPTGYPKAAALQTKNVPNTVGARNRTANKE